MAKRSAQQPKKVETLKHDEATRKNIPTAEYQSVMAEDKKNPVQVAYERRNRDLSRDGQLNVKRDDLKAFPSLKPSEV